MSGTSAFWRCSGWAKSDSKTPLSTPSKLEVCKFEGLIRGPDNNLSTRESAFAFFCLPKWVNSVRRFLRSMKIWKLVRGKRLGFQTFDGQRSTAKTSCSMSRQMVKDRERESNNFYELQTSYGCPKFSSLLPSCSVQREQSNVALKFCHFMSFYAMQIFLSGFTLH